MTIDRRSMLAAAGLLGLAAGPTHARAQTPAPAQAAPSLNDRLATRASENRYRLDFAGGRFSGPGWDFLIDEGRKARFFLLGEEHGIAENPMLAAALFAELAPSGYDTLAIETSPLMAAELDRASAGGVDGLRQLLADPRSQAAFFGMREEAGMLAAIRAAVPPGRPVLWGLDYDIAADRLAIARLKARPKPAAAAAALARLEAASLAAWAQYEATRGPQHIFNFSGDPALVRAVREAWPDADPEAAWMLTVLEETLEINRLFLSGSGLASNQRRAELNKANLFRYWRQARSEGRSPRAMFKFGANHMVRGLNMTEAFDLGTTIPELAAFEGESTFSLMVLPGSGRSVAVLDPVAWTYRESEPRDDYAAGLEPVAGQAFDDVFTVIDLRPLRALLPGQRTAGVNRELVRMVHGFDGLLVMSGSTPSRNL